MEITRTPYNVALAGNPMRYGFHVGDNDPGIPPKATLSFSGKDTVVDHTIGFTLMGQPRTFILKETPAVDYELPVATPEESLGAWIARVLTAIQSIEEVTTYYDVTLDGTDIIMTCKESNPDFDIVIDESSPIVGIDVYITPGELPHDEDPGTYSRANLVFSAKDKVVDHTIECTVMGEVRTFILKASPVYDYEIPVAIEEESLSDWMDRILARLQDPETEIGAIYDVDIEEADIRITAKSPNPYFDITVKVRATGIAIETVAGELPSWDYGQNYEPGVKASATLTFSDTDTVVDHTLECTIMGQLRTFILKEVPFTDYELPVALIEDTVEIWMAKILTRLEDGYEIGTNYNAVIDGATIVITSKEFGLEYDIAIIQNNIVGIVITPVVPLLPNWTYVGVLMQIRRDMPNGALIGEEYKPLDVNNSASFDVAEYLYAVLLNFNQRHFWNTLPNGIVKYYTDYVLNYCVSFRPVTAYNQYGTKVSDTLRSALGGGFSREMLVKNNLSGNPDWFTLQRYYSQFLTWMPRERMTDRFEKISLFYLQQSNMYLSVWCRITVTFATGSMMSYVIPFIMTDERSVTEFTVGYEEIKQAIVTNQDFVQWEFSIEAEDNSNLVSEITEPIIFKIDFKYQENTRYFRFRNSFGAYDSLRCTGKFESFGEYERVETTYLNFSNNEIDTNSPRAHTKVTGTKPTKANTGFVTKEYLLSLNDFMLSREIYEYLDGQMQKVLINSKKVNMVEDKNNNYSLSFEYEYASQNEFHSNI